MAQEVTQSGAVSLYPDATEVGAQNAAARVSRSFKKSFYVDPINGNDGSSGQTWDTPLATIAAALLLCTTGDQIILLGKTREQVTPSNLLGYIQIIGAARRSAYGDAPWYGGAAWLAPVSPTATTPLLVVRGQGWYLENLLMDGPADAAAIELERNASSGNDEYDASHFSMDGCRLVSGQSGIEVIGGVYNISINGTTFQSNTNGLKCMDTSVDVMRLTEITNCRFTGNTNDILASMIEGKIIGNNFMTDSTVKINTKYNAGQGSLNKVMFNNFPQAGTDVKEDDGYLGTATDQWANYSVGTAALIVESPPGAS